YDAIYRLIKALGREHLGQFGGVPNAPTPTSYNDWSNINLPHPNDGKAIGSYVENFSYDPAGNIQRIQHIGSQPHSSGWTRDYAYKEASQLTAGNITNRLTSTAVGGGGPDNFRKSRDGCDTHGNIRPTPTQQLKKGDFE